MTALLIACLFAVATGAARHLHELQYAHDHAAEHADDHDQQPAHDENNCAIHAILIAPAIFTQWVPLLVLLGLIVAFLTDIAPVLRSQHPAFRIDCRGPPACA